MVIRRDKDQEFRERVLPRILAIRHLLRRVVIFVNGKGGTGKTSTCANCAANLAAMLASAGSKQRVLAFELDIQGNLKSEFGQKGKGGDDNGRSIAHAIAGTGKLNVIRDVRPNLDLVPSGPELERAAKLLASASDHDRIEYWVTFMEAVAELAGDKEWILVDCSPGDKELQRLAVALGMYVIVPTTFDLYSRYGLEQIGDLFSEVGWVNEDIDILGVVLFGFERRESRAIKDKQTQEVTDYKEVGQRQRLRRVITADLERAGSDAVVFNSVISNARVPGEVCRQLGVLAAELSDTVQSEGWSAKRKWLADDSRLGGLVTVSPDTAESLAADYEDLTGEAFARVLELEKEGGTA